MQPGTATRPLGRSGIELPVLGLGGATIGNLHGPVSAADAAQVLDAAWQHGLRYFDTAPLYGRGLGELRVGQALRARPRDQFVLSTKVGWRFQPLARQAAPAGSLPFAARCDYSREGTLRSLEDSLLRLGLDRIDIAFVHDVDPYNHGEAYPERLREVLDGALPTLYELRRQGVVRAVGVGVNDRGVCLDILRATEVDAFLLAGRYTLLDRRASDELLPLCRERGVGVVLGAPFNTGVLAAGSGPAASAARFNHGPVAPDVAARVQAMSRACARHGTSLMAAALNFPLTDPAVAAVLPGPRSAAQLEQIAAAFAEPVPDALWRELAEL